jgi:hypothetical protein
MVAGLSSGQTAWDSILQIHGVTRQQRANVTLFPSFSSTISTDQLTLLTLLAL